MDIINSASALYAALKACKGGEELPIGTISEPVRLTGLSFTDKPVTLAGGSIALPGPVDESQPVLAIAGCTGLSVKGMKLSGFGEDRAQRGFGASISGGSKAIAITGCTIQRCARGIILTDTSFSTIARNDLSAIRSDGINIVATSDLDVDENQMFGFTPYLPGDPALDDHPDGIQFWTKGAKAGCARVRVRRNLIAFTPTERGQGIFGGDDDLGYLDFTIEDNVILSPLWNGILFTGGAQRLVLNRNTILNVPGGPVDPQAGPVRPAIKVIASATMAGNVAPAWGVTDGAGKVIYGPPAGNSANKDVAQADADAAIAAWRAAYRPQPVPPVLTPTPMPTPAPTPTPATPDAKALAALRAHLAKQVDEANLIQNAGDRLYNAATKTLADFDKLFGK